MYPHERSLVNRMKDKPFVLLGINSDPDREQLKKVVKKEELVWRSWFEGSIEGPIAKHWNVSGWPTLYVLDHRGVIRRRDAPGGQALDNTIDKLIDEQAAETRPK